MVLSMELFIPNRQIALTDEYTCIFLSSISWQDG
jgi:hypothetical protein